MYSYTQKDLFKGSPQHYHYSPYEGAKFLEEYIFQRKQALESIRHRLDNLGNDTNSQLASDILDWYKNHKTKFHEKFLEENNIIHEFSVIETNLLLRSIIFNILEADSPPGSRVHRLIDGLINKFEVSKRLRLSYDKDMNPLDKNTHASLQCYTLFGFCISSELKRNTNLKWLNALIKLNDVISSTSFDDENSLTYAAAIISFEQELSSVAHVANQNHVSMSPIPYE